MTDPCCAFLSEGGVGKTMLTACVVRDERIRAAFEVIGWVTMSQVPDLLQLQGRLFQQLADNKEMPKAGSKSIASGTTELQKIASHRTVLIVCDDLWDSAHEKAFACLDESTPSRLLVTTRIKGILAKGVEGQECIYVNWMLACWYSLAFVISVELELLGMTESVQL